MRFGHFFLYYFQRGQLTAEIEWQFQIAKTQKVYL